MARRKKRRYTVRTGDTATAIAEQLGIDPKTLMRANVGVTNLRPGMVLGVPRDKDPTPRPPFLPTTDLRPRYGDNLLWPSASPDYNYQRFTDRRAQFEQGLPRGIGQPDYRYQRFTDRETQFDQGLPRGIDQPDYSRTRTLPPTDREAQYDQGLPRGIGQPDYRRTHTKVFQDRGIWQGRKPPTKAIPTEGAAEGGGEWEYIPYEAFQTLMRGKDAAGRAKLAELAKEAAENYGFARVESEAGDIYTVHVRDYGGGDVRFTPVSGKTASLIKLKRAGGGKGPSYRGRRGQTWRPSGRRRQSAAERHRGEMPPRYGQEPEPAPAPTTEGLESWMNQVTGWYGEDIWEEARRTIPPAEEPAIPPPTGEGEEEITITGTPYDFTTWASPAFERYSQLEKTDTKLGFYDWYQESQYVFGAAAWDKVMGKTIGGEYDTDKAKSSYAAYLGYTPDWEEEEEEFGGAAYAPRYQAGQYFDYDSRGGAVPMTRRYARPNYLGLINWRI